MEPLPPDSDPARWRMLGLLALAELLGMSPWFSGSAVAPLLGVRWELGPSGLAALTSSVQLGFVLGTAVAAVLNLADVWPARRLFAGSAFLAALANAAFAVAPGFPLALAARFATGFFLAGVYPPAMKMAATWFRAGRGLAIGAIVGAVTTGKATPYLLHAFPGHGVGSVVLPSSLAAAVGALLVGLGYRDGPFRFATRPFSWGLVGEVIRERRWRLATGGYLGHMFELYSFWTWIPAFLAASAVAHQTSLGFLLTLVSIQLVSSLAGQVGWRWAFPVLALGPAAGIAATRRLVRLRRELLAAKVAARGVGRRASAPGAGFDRFRGAWRIGFGGLEAAQHLGPELVVFRAGEESLAQQVVELA